MIIASRTEAGRLLMSSGAGIDCLLSIGGPGDRHPAGFRRVAKRLRLEFSDVDDDVPGDVPPCRADVEKIVTFARVVRSSQGITLVHCEAGISRSAAAALIVIASIAGVGLEREAVAELFRIHPHASPNRLMVRLADELLGHDGRLLAAVDESDPP
jgi:predicted protein tyrosine phosphatase